MMIFTVLLLGALQTAPDSAFVLQCNLQGIYDEIGVATIGARSASDIDTYQAVFYMPDWVFIDDRGVRRDLAAERARALDARQPRFTTVRHAIRKIETTPDGALVTLNLVTVRTLVDTDGKYGRAGLTHTIAEVTRMRDTWTRSGVTWKLQKREQMGAPHEYVDKMPSEIESPRCPS